MKKQRILVVAVSLFMLFAWFTIAYADSSYDEATKGDLSGDRNKVGLPIVRATFTLSSMIPYAVL